MREMKDSGVEWIGEIPIEWKICKLKNIASIQTGNTPPKNVQSTFYSDESGTPWIKAEDLGERDSISKTKEYLTEDGKKEGRIFPANTVFVCCIASIGKTGFSVQECSCNQQINGIIFNKMQWKYGYYMTLAQESEYIFNASGNVMKIINTEKQGNLWCPLPTKYDQERIVDYLDAKCLKVDEIIEKQQAIIEKLKEYKLSIINEAVTQGINPDVNMKQSGYKWIGSIPKHWNMVYAKQLFSQRKDRAFENDEQLTASQKYGVISQKEFMDIEGRQVMQVIKGEEILKHVEKGDFVISMRSFQGGLEYSEVSGKISSAYVMLIPNRDKVYDRYYKWLFKSKKYISALQGTSNLIRDGQALRFSNFVQVYLPSFDLDEQKQIADYLDDICPKIDNEIEKREKLLEKVMEYKKSLIYEVVTGKKEV